MPKTAFPWGSACNGDSEQRGEKIGNGAGIAQRHVRAAFRWVVRLAQGLQLAVPGGCMSASLDDLASHSAYVEHGSRSAMTTVETTATAEDESHLVLEKPLARMPNGPVKIIVMLERTRIPRPSASWATWKAARPAESARIS